MVCISNARKSIDSSRTYDCPALLQDSNIIGGPVTTMLCASVDLTVAAMWEVFGDFKLWGILWCLLRAERRKRQFSLNDPTALVNLRPCWEFRLVCHWCVKGKWMPFPVHWPLQLTQHQLAVLIQKKVLPVDVRLHPNPQGVVDYQSENGYLQVFSHVDVPNPEDRPDGFCLAFEGVFSTWWCTRSMALTLAS